MPALSICGVRLAISLTPMKLQPNSNTTRNRPWHLPFMDAFFEPPLHLIYKHPRSSVKSSLPLLGTLFRSAASVRLYLKPFALSSSSKVSTPVLTQLLFLHGLSCSCEPSGGLRTLNRRWLPVVSCQCFLRCDSPWLARFKGVSRSISWPINC